MNICLLFVFPESHPTNRQTDGEELKKKKGGKNAKNEAEKQIKKNRTKERDEEERKALV